MKVPAGTLGRGPLRALRQAGLRAIPAGLPCRLGERIALPPPTNKPGRKQAAMSTEQLLHELDLLVEPSIGGLQELQTLVKLGDVQITPPFAPFH